MVHLAGIVNPPTREEVLALYDAGPEAMLALVAALVDRIAAVERANTALERTVTTLTARVQHLDDRLARDSHNSSKPPSSDWGPRARPPGTAGPRTRSLRPPPGTSGRRSGGQPGHPGTTLRLVDTPDQVLRHRPLGAQCGTCGAALVGGAERVDAERRQVVDLPPPRLVVTEHRVVRVACPGCGAETAGAFPLGVTQPVQYGDRLVAVGVYLHAYQLLPYARTRELLGDLFGAAPSEGTLQTAATACAAGLVPVAAAIAAALRRAPVGHFDETGVRVTGQRQWWHVASTPTLTHYGVHPRRGTGALDALGILPGFRGVAVHDAYPSYRTYGECTHALCNAHLLRELVFLHEHHHQAWADELATLLVTAKDLTDTARASGRAALDEVTVATLEAHYDHLLWHGHRANPPLAPPLSLIHI